MDLISGMVRRGATQKEPRASGEERGILVFDSASAISEF